MMRNRWMALAAAVYVAAWTGCGGSKPSGPEAGAETSSDGPAQAVFKFLEAVRTGNDSIAQAMLTKMAQQKTAELEMMVAPPGSDTASFEVGEVETTDGQTARVASSWSDMEHDGSRRTDYITWLLRREAAGWRISGMTTELVPNEGPVVLNFENPREIREHLAGSESEGTQENLGNDGENFQEARRPEDPFRGEGAGSPEIK